MWRASSLLLVLTTTIGSLHAQAVEGLMVEVYHVNPADKDRGPGTPPLPAGAVTYRIFLDLAEGHQLQAVYGDRNHPLHLGTTGRFYNDRFYGRETGDDVPVDHVREHIVALDSWITVAFATEDHLAVPKRNDPDGSLFPNLRSATNSARAGDLEGADICTSVSDGLVPTDSVIEVVQFGMDLLPMAFNADDRNILVNDTLLHTTNGGWAVLGGANGASPGNLVLIAQVTTDGELYYAFNVQVEAPDGSTARWVWNEPGPQEILGHMLRSEHLPFPAPLDHERP